MQIRWKDKRKVTVEAIVGGITGAIEDPRTLLLGRLAGHSRRLRYIARTAARAEPAPGDRPTAHRRDRRPPVASAAARGWIGRLDRREPQPYVQVEPLLVAEIVVDRAYDRGRFRHPVRHPRIRSDLDPGDVERWRP